MGKTYSRNNEYSKKFMNARKSNHKKTIKPRRIQEVDNRFDNLDYSSN